MGKTLHFLHWVGVLGGGLWLAASGGIALWGRNPSRPHRQLPSPLALSSASPFFSLSLQGLYLSSLCVSVYQSSPFRWLFVTSLWGFWKFSVWKWIKRPLQLCCPYPICQGPTALGLVLSSTSGRGCSGGLGLRRSWGDYQPSKMCRSKREDQLGHREGGQQRNGTLRHMSNVWGKQTNKQTWIGWNLTATGRTHDLF